jgi:FtsP/CotA-like multicopper oxidase with cupredoxin domain
MDSRINRRLFVAGASVALAGQAASRLMPTSTAKALQPQIPDGVTQFRVRLPIPKILRPIHTDSTTDYYEMTQEVAWTEIIPGLRTQIWGYNGTFPGPTIKGRCGRRTVVTHTNKLQSPSVVHLHGGVTRPESDGFPMDLVAPGEKHSYEYDNAGRAATLWYHDHSHHDAGRKLYMGLAGFYLLDDGDDMNSQLPRDNYDIPLMLQDRAFTGGQLAYDHHGHRGANGSVMLVNGAPWPMLEVATRKYRFRILNASNAKPMRLALGTGDSMVQIATDHGLLPKPIALKTIDLSMAERVEVVVDFSDYPIGSRVFLENRFESGPLRQVMRFDVVRVERDDSVVPRVLTEFEPLLASQAARTRTFVFGGRPQLGLPPKVEWLINDKPFDPDRVDAAPKLGEVEIWRFVNRGFLGFSMLHPVHTHLVPFQILRRNGGPPLPHESGWKDIVAVADGEEVEVIMRWSGFRGRYLLHCHNLEHEDHRMMARIDVT